MGRLVSSQRQNNMPEYKAPEGLAPSDLISAWESLQAEEVSYEEELLGSLDAYTKMQAAYEEFVSTSDMILHWAEEKQQVFDTAVDPAEEMLPPAVGTCRLVGLCLCVFVWFLNEWSGVLSVLVWLLIVLLRRE